MLWFAAGESRPEAHKPWRWIGWVVLPLAWASFARSEVWLDDYRLWVDAAAKAPWSGLAHNNLAQANLEHKDVDAAVAEFQKTLQVGVIDGTDNLAYNNLAIILSSPQYGKYYDPQMAVRLIEQGIARSPRFEDAFTLRYNLANVLSQMKVYPRALQIIRELERDLGHSANQRYAFLLERARELRALLEKVAP